jgi:hypothetical protein
MTDKVRVSAASGVLRVVNDSAEDVIVELGGDVAAVSPSSQKEFALAEGVEYAVVVDGDCIASNVLQMERAGRPPADADGYQDPERTAPPGSQSVPGAPAEGAANASSASLIGSSLQPATFADVLVDMTAPRGTPLADSVILASDVHLFDRENFRELQLGDIVSDAQARAMVGDRKMTVDEWNDQPQDEREKAVAGSLELILAAAGKAKQA